MTILNTIEEHVTRIAKEKYPDCYGKDMDVWVSRLDGFKEGTEYLVLTMKHMGRAFSRYLYPRVDSPWDLDNLETLIESLYCQTM